MLDHVLHDSTNLLLSFIQQGYFVGIKGLGMSSRKRARVEINDVS